MINNTQTFLAAGALFGASGVVLGAWGAHGLSAYLGRDDTGAWETAGLYQVLHAIGLLVVAVLVRLSSHQSLSLRLSGYLMVMGILLFSGSIYALVLGAPRWVGPMTPLGGVAFICAWLALFVSAWQDPQKK